MPKPSPLHVPSGPRSPLSRRGARVLTLCLTLAALSAVGGGGVSGCAAGPDPSRAGPPFPAQLSQTRVLDIQVFRRGNRIWMTNTTANPIGPGRLWLNAWFSHELDQLDVGETVEMKLSSFRDQYGDPFRGGGGFFAARDPEAIVLAQILQSAAYTPAAPEGATGDAPAPTPAPNPAPTQELVGLIVVGGGPTN